MTAEQQQQQQKENPNKNKTTIGYLTLFILWAQFYQM